MYDLNYTDSGLFIQFLPNTPPGVKAHNVIAAHYDGVAKVPFYHLEATLSQLRKAGLSVGKLRRTKITTPQEDDKLLDDLDL